ncbi:Protein of unknown function DUF262 [Paracidovorax valerianellae]|uniref:GmrSD restriction endonucleases N-terminal domain-containing protein n=2 Tax=Paracidovorax valerianellae TaxID=187868 RepID=A0A1G6PW20_9BURK|nr:Protein of unknown function DUF262 [Paracidovorax valerianellae]
MLPMPATDQADLVEAQIAELQKETDYEIREWPIEVLVEKFTNGRDNDTSEIFIPDYQREMVWSAKQQSRFIESILIRLPVPFIFAADVGTGDREGALEIIDGSQRLRTLDHFLNDKLRLVGLQRLTNALGMRFSDLARPRQLRFKRSTIRVIELTEKADEQARREMFDRLNSGGTKLTSMETRRGVEDGPFMAFITECARTALFKEMVKLSDRNASRKEHEEFALRYFAYANNYLNFRKSVVDFLDEYLKDGNEHATTEILGTLAAELQQTLEFVKQHFPCGFKREGHTTVPRIRFEAIAVGVTLALREQPDLQPAPVNTWLDSKEFIQHTRSDASNSRPKLRNRIHYVRDHLLGRTVQLDPETELVENSANADAHEEDELQQQQGLFT